MAFAIVSHPSLCISSMPQVFGKGNSWRAFF